jgi:hypothetical protein
VSYSYGPQAPYNGGPHAALSGAWSGAGSAGYGYDAAGNLTGGPGRSLTWYADNTLQTVSSGGGTEQYFYDPDGERLARSHGGRTTVYVAGPAGSR